MKKFLSILLVAALALALVSCADTPNQVTYTANVQVTDAPTAEPAEEPTAEPAEEPTAEPAATGDAESATASIKITISDGQGKLVVTNSDVTVSDKDGDGKLTVDDALKCAHEAYYTAGTGYENIETEYGLSIKTLWGDTSGSYGYYLNNGMCFSLVDEIKAGDYLDAFVYTDAVGYSDSYSYFNVTEAETAVGEVVTLTLSNNSGFDANFNPVFTGTAGAVITVNGADTEFKTAEDGTVSLTFDQAGTYTVSARSDSATLVPAVCVITVK